MTEGNVALHPRMQVVRSEVITVFARDPHRDQLVAGFDKLVTGDRVGAGALLFFVPLGKVADMVTICKKHGLYLLADRTTR